MLRSILLLTFLGYAFWANSDDLDKLERSISEIKEEKLLPYGVYLYESLNLTDQDRKNLKDFESIRTEYHALINRYAVMTGREDTYVFSYEEIAQIHNDIFKYNLKFLEETNPDVLNGVNKSEMISKVESETFKFSRNLVEEVTAYNQSVQDKKPKPKNLKEKASASFKKILNKIGYTAKNMPINPRQLSKSAKIHSRPIALTFLVSFIANFTLPAIISYMGYPKLARIVFLAIQPVLFQGIAHVLYKFIRNTGRKKLVGLENYNLYQEFLDELKSKVPFSQNFLVLKRDLFYRFHYRSRFHWRQIFLFWTRSRAINYQRIKAFVKNNPELLGTYKKINSMRLNYKQKTFEFVLEMQRLNDENTKRFNKHFQNAFEESPYFYKSTEDIMVAEEWFRYIIEVKDYPTFSKALLNPPENISAVIYFEMLETLIMPRFAEFKEVKYKTFRKLLKVIYEQKYKNLVSGNYALDKQSLQIIHDKIMQEAEASIDCPSWVSKQIQKLKQLIH